MDKQLRVADDVDEQNVANLKFQIRFGISGHIAIRPGIIRLARQFISELRRFRQITIGKKPHREPDLQLPGTPSDFSRSHDAVIRVYDEAGNVIEISAPSRAGSTSKDFPLFRTSARAHSAILSSI